MYCCPSGLRFLMLASICICVRIARSVFLARANIRRNSAIVVIESKQVATSTRGDKQRNNTQHIGLGVAAEDSGNRKCSPGLPRHSALPCQGYPCRRRR